MKTKTVNGSKPQAADELIKKATEMTQVLAKHNIQMPKAPSARQKLKATQSGGYYENGMAMNITHGIQLVDYLITYGTAYNPSNTALTVASLQAMNTQGQTLLTASNAKRQGKKVAIDARQAIYGTLLPDATRIINELKACGAPKTTVENAKYYVNKIRGKRIGKVDPLDPTNHISPRQTSFPEQVQHLTNLIGVLAGCPQYIPNVADLTVAALETKRDGMVSSNAAVSMTQAVWSTARIERNQYFNAEGTGYVDTFLAAKSAVKAIFGATSPQYQQVKGLMFTRID